MRYIKVMDELALRQPLWLQLSMHEFWAIKERMPEDGLLVHHYRADGAPMVEVHVDLDDSFDAKRATLPLGGRFSVRFPGKPPTDTALRHAPPDLPSPGTGLTCVPPSDAGHTGPLAADPPAADEVRNAAARGDGQLPTVSEINKMKVNDLKARLAALGQLTTGLRADLVSRLRQIV